jgi:hypothetical protein
MKKIMFNDKYGLTQAVLEGRKTQTRRMLNPTMFFQRLETYEGWSNEDISAWKRSCNRRLDEAQGDTLQQMLDCALSSSRYKLGETIAIAQRYEDMAKDDDLFRLCCNIFGRILFEKGCHNKMFVRADLMPHHIRITNIRVERLQDIREEDCLKEGIWRGDNVGLEGTTYWYHGLANSSFRTAKEAYAALIDKISGKGTWESNPWVFVYDFELVK